MWYSWDRFNAYCALLSSCHLYRFLSLDYDLDLFSELTVSHLHDSMVSTCDGSADAKTAQPDGHSSPPNRQPSLKQASR
jgi:hypothetical protein